jgi:hypothetical protein
MSALRFAVILMDLSPFKEFPDLLGRQAAHFVSLRCLLLASPAYKNFASFATIPNLSFIF